MKIEQKPKFQPIVMTLETAKEAEALWAAVDRQVETINDGDYKSILIGISNWFSNNAQIGG
jgi:hypothetical protein